MTTGSGDHTGMQGLSKAVARASARVDLDDTDRAILALLAADARMSQRQIAKQIGMSAPSVGERIAKLERSGVIKAYSITVDWAAVGLPILVYLPVTIAPGTDLEELLMQLRAVPELEQLSVVTGGYDLVARFRVSDYNHLQKILLDRLYPIRGLQRFETLLSLGEVPVEDLWTRTFGAPADPES